jgi:hypothetical protein
MLLPLRYNRAGCAGAVWQPCIPRHPPSVQWWVTCAPSPSGARLGESCHAWSTCCDRGHCLTVSISCVPPPPPLHPLPSCPDDILKQPQLLMTLVVELQRLLLVPNPQNRTLLAGTSMLLWVFTTARDPVLRGLLWQSGAGEFILGCLHVFVAKDEPEVRLQLPSFFTSKYEEPGAQGRSPGVHQAVRTGRHCRRARLPLPLVHRLVRPRCVFRAPGPCAAPFPVLLCLYHESPPSCVVCLLTTASIASPQLAPAADPHRVPSWDEPWWLQLPRASGAACADPNAKMIVRNAAAALMAVPDALVEASGDFADLLVSLLR